MAQTQYQEQAGQQETGINNPDHRADRVDPRRQQVVGELPKQQNQDPKRRGDHQIEQQDDSNNSLELASILSGFGKFWSVRAEVSAAAEVNSPMNLE
jgi:hypothetical protein